MDELFAPVSNVETRWASAENPRGMRGAGGQANGGRKGKPCLSLAPGEAATLAEEPAGVSGTIRRIWVTIEDRSPEMLRGLRMEAFWDGAETPAISAPLGDFFGLCLGKCVPFESAIFSNPEGRSFNCRLPMPFLDGMRIVVTNDTEKHLRMFFYDVNYTVGDSHPAGTLYLHAHFRRENPTTLREDFEILPAVFGRGRFLGANVGVRADQVQYGKAWWGEGEVKVFLDGDTEFPTLCGTGTEDYIGTGWGQGAYAQAYQGCPVADHDRMEYSFYRYHIPDPIYFHDVCRVTIQQIGGCSGEEKKWLAERVRTDGNPVYRAVPGEVPADLTGDNFVLFDRVDDWSSCAYFYLNRPENGLPPLPALGERTVDLT